MYKPSYMSCMTDGCPDMHGQDPIFNEIVRVNGQASWCVCVCM